MSENYDQYQTFRYSDIVFSYYSSKDMMCGKMVKEHCLVYVYSGEYILEEGKKKTVVKPGECVFLRRDNRVEMAKLPKNGEPFMAIFMNFKRNFLRGLYQKFERRELPHNIEKHRQSVVKLPDSPDFKSLFISMVPYFDSSIKPSDEIMNLKMQEGMHALLRADERFYATLFDFTEPWKIDILDFLNENYMCELSMEEIASFTGRSLSTFKRDFRKISDLPPQKWLIQKRLDAANEMLRKDGRKVSDVYVEVGFKNLSHFSSAFKKQFGVAPSTHN